MCDTTSSQSSSYSSDGRSDDGSRVRKLLIPRLDDQQWLEYATDIDSSTYLVSREPQRESITLVKPTAASSPSLLSAPPPPRSIKLSIIDSTMPQAWHHTVYGLRNSNGPSNFLSPDTLKDALSQVLDKVPILAGEMDCSIPHMPKVALSGRGAWLSLGYLKVPFNNMIHQYMGHNVLPSPLIFHSLQGCIRKGSLMGGGGLAPLFAVKAIYYPCGSLSLTSYVHHQVMDQSSLHHIMQLWGALCRGDMVPPNWFMDNRNILPTAPSPSSSLNSSTMVLPATMGRRRMTMIRIGITMDRLKILSSLADHSGPLEALYDDLLCAAVWKLHISLLDPLKTTRVTWAIDIRPHLKLQPDSLGNLTMVQATEPKLVGEVNQWDIITAATYLNTALSLVSHRSIRDHIISLMDPDTMNHLHHLSSSYDPTCDLLVSGTSNLIQPEDISFSETSYCCQKIFSASYCESSMVINPSYNNELYATLPVDLDVATKLLSMPQVELARCGFKLKIMEHLRFYP